MKLKLKWFFTLIMALFVQLSFAQEKTVTGTVLEDGLPLPGVSVVVKGTTYGTQTDFDGKYTIKVKTGETLVYSFIGMDTVSQTVGESSTMNLTMLAEDSQLEEVIVMAYGQVKKKNEVTGSAVKVDGNIIAESPFVNPDQALQGRVAGLQMSTTSGTAGSSQQIRIRGISGIGGNLEPLYVIDGVPVVNNNMSGSANVSSISPLSSINSSDIESITVLKDATATAPYGARGAAGVIVITTKKGKSGVTKFSLTSTAGIMNRAVKGLQMVNGAQKNELFNEALYNDFGTQLGFAKEDADQYFVNNPGDIPNNPTRSALSALQTWKGLGSPESDWSKLMQNKDALYYNLDFSAQGGNETSTFYSSISYNKTESVAIGGDFRRVTGTLAYDTKLNDKLRFKSNIRFSNSKQDAITEQGAYFSNPMSAQYFTSPWFQAYNRDGSINITNMGSNHNVLYTSKNNKLQNDLSRWLGTFGVDYDITKGLRWNTTANIDFAMNNFQLYYNPLHGDGLSVDGLAGNSNDFNFNYVIQNGLDYSFGIDKHKFNTKALMEFQKNKYSYLSADGQNIPLGFNQLANAAANWSATNLYQDWSQLSYTALVNYNYDGKYLVDASYRYEGSSRFNPGMRWGNFWSVGAAWNMMNENFMENVTWVNLLRLRASYGVTGNNGVPVNNYQALLSTGNYGTSSSLQLNQLPAIISWESQAKTDVGIDYGIFDNRINGSVAYYHSKSSDLLFVSNPITSTTGHSTTPINAGAMVNKGWEFELGADVIRGDNFSFNVSANFATVHNEITAMQFDAVKNQPKTIISSRSIIAEGQPLNAWYMRKYAGVNPTTGVAEYYINGKDGATTTNYNQAQQAVQGQSALPKYTGGLTLHFDIYNFYIDGTFYYSGGNKVYENIANYTNATGNSGFSDNYSMSVYERRWQQPGDITDVPKLTTGVSTAENTSTRFLYDGDYIRLRDVAIGYRFPSEMLKNSFVDAVSLSLRGTNLWTWVKDDRLKYDPEIASTGLTSMSNPPIKQVTFSMNIKF